MDAPIPYTLKKSPRSRALRISVFCDGSVTVTAPAFAGQGAIDRFVAARSEWIRRKLESFMPFRPYVAPHVLRKASRAVYLKHKEATRELVMRRIPELNRAYGFRVGRISIRDQRSRWGSCSAKGNLNFNYRLALIPSHLADYVIVHELCHLGEMNHSPRFWSLVAKTMPNYRQLVRELKNASLIQGII